MLPDQHERVGVGSLHPLLHPPRNFRKRKQNRFDIRRIGYSYRRKLKPHSETHIDERRNPSGPLEIGNRTARDLAEHDFLGGTARQTLHHHAVEMRA